MLLNRYIKKPIFKNSKYKYFRCDITKENEVKIFIKDKKYKNRCSYKCCCNKSKNIKRKIL